MNSDFLERPVFICGHRKTGTTLLINLFDYAGDAVVYPDDSGMFYLYYPRYATDKYTSNEKLERLGDFLARDHLGDILSRPKCSDAQRKELYEKVDRFRESVRNYSGNDFTFRPLLKYFFECYWKVFYSDLKEPKVWLEKTTSTEIYAVELHEMFPRAKFIHLLRDPRDNWASLQSGWEERYKEFNDELNRLKQSMIERGRLGMEMAEFNQETIGPDSYKIVRFEDLTRDPKKIMKDLADFVGIQYSENLLRPSIMGYPWGGNNFEGKKFEEPSAVNVDRWKRRISEEDAQLMEFHFRNLMERYDYRTFFSLREAQKAAINHYKWFNYSTPYAAT